MASSPMDDNTDIEHISYLSQMPYQTTSSAMYSHSASEMSSKLATYNLISTNMIAARASPCPSVGSDITNSSSSPYDSNPVMDTGNRHTVSVSHDDELSFDHLINWFWKKNISLRRAHKQVEQGKLATERVSSQETT